MMSKEKNTVKKNGEVLDTYEYIESLYDTKIVKADFHVHSRFGSDGFKLASPKKLLENAEKKGIKIVGVVGHNSIYGVEEYIKYAEENNFSGVVLPGVEITIKDDMIDGYERKTFDALVFFSSYSELKNFYEKEIKKHIPMSLLPYQSPVKISSDILKSVKERNGLVILAHAAAVLGNGLADHLNGAINKYSLSEEEIEKYRQKIKERFDLIETRNGENSNEKNIISEKFASELGIPGVGGSDAHGYKEVGNTYTVIKGIDLKDSKEEIIKKLKNYKEACVEFKSEGKPLYGILERIKAQGLRFIPTIPYQLTIGYLGRKIFSVPNEAELIKNTFKSLYNKLHYLMKWTISDFRLS